MDARVGRLLLGAPRIAVFSVLVSGTAACSEALETPGSTFTVWDSAGVPIVHSEGPLWNTSPGWSLSEQPLVEIGVRFGAESHTLSNVGDVIRLPGDRIAVVNTGTAQIRVYSISGEHLQDLGRSGDGPGEFRRVRRLWVTPHDSVMAYDGSLSRVTVYAPDLSLVRTMAIRPQGGASQAFVLRSFDDGQLLVDEIIRPPGRPRAGLFSGGVRRFTRYSSDGARVNTIGELAASNNWGFSTGDAFAYTTAPFSVIFPPSQGDGRSLYLGPGLLPQVEHRSPSGQLIRVIRWSEARRAVDSEVIEQFRTWRLGLLDDPDYRQSTLAMLEGLEFPELIPVYQSLRVDLEGHLWVERYRTRGEEDRRWWVFDPDGRWLGEPPVPTDIDVKEVGSDYLLGVRRDDLDVESVVMYRLDRTES